MGATASFVARVVGTLYLSGAALIALSLALPHPAGSNDAALYAIVGLAAATGGAFVLGSARIPVWLIHIVIALGSTLISLCVYFSGNPGGVYPAMFLWAILASACFFPGLPAGAQLTYMVVAYAVTLARLPTAGGFSSVTRWVIYSFALTVAWVVITWIVRRSEEVERERLDLARIVEESHDAVIGKTLDGKITSWNRSAQELYGYSPAEICGSNISVLVPDDRPDELPSILARIRRGEVVAQHETVRRARDGRLIDVSITVSPIRDQTGQVTGASSVTRDITERRRLEAEQQRLLRQLEQLSRTDSLTGLANRRSFDEHLDREMARARRHRSTLCLALVDLDHFKAFNDEHGHVEGDELLRQAARAWRSVLRVTDQLARFGGDEFAVLLPECPLSEAEEIVQRLEAMTPGDQTCSLGLTCWDLEASAQELLRRADLALYGAKRAGRDRMVVADPSRS